jgi:hypothetical protein
MQGLSDHSERELINKISLFWLSEKDRLQIAITIQAINACYDLSRKMADEPEVQGIIEQLFGRLSNAYPKLTALKDKKILDIACGSNTSKAPCSFYFDRLFHKRSDQASSEEYTAIFEPWFCRILLELGAIPVGVDFGDLEGEKFQHHHVDLGLPGALDFLPDHSFDGIQDSRLFGSPEFTAEFPHQADRLKVAHEIVRQEKRLLKPDGIIIHSDAMQLVK